MSSTHSIRTRPSVSVPYDTRTTRITSWATPSSGQVNLNTSPMLRFDACRLAISVTLASGTESCLRSPSATRDARLPLLMPG